LKDKEAKPGPHSTLNMLTTVFVVTLYVVGFALIARP